MANIFKRLGDATADLLSNSDFINRSIGMSNSYEDIMFIVQALGREPISLLGKDYLYIFDHVRRNYNIGTNVMDYNSNECPKFTFYKEKPTVRFANPYDDPMNLLSRWMPNVDFEKTSIVNGANGTLYSYAESEDGETNNRVIDSLNDVNKGGNNGIYFGGIASFANNLPTCDLIKKTNDNFNHGKYETLIARFHTKAMSSKNKEDITQTAFSSTYGQSHGRNLLRKYSPNFLENGYENPYCRVWTYHHQYNQLERAIRPFDLQSEEMLEEAETLSGYKTVGFRTQEDKQYKFDGGSKRLDTYGVLNYKNGLVNIAPTAKIKDYFEHKEDKEVSVKKCMFSIENLAWRTDNIKTDEYDSMGLSPEQKGPLGGRIMWFPPYDLTFNESVNVQWNSNEFIGRGEKVYTYTNTERTGNLSFTLLIDHPSILDYWSGSERNGLKNQNDILDIGNTGGIDNINNQENTLLRFFAGCEILTAKPQEFRKRNFIPEKTEDPPAAPVNDPPDAGINRPQGKKKLYCFAFFPNNYSGVDDAPTTANKVNAIHYLLNGIGTQRRFNVITQKGEDFLVDMSENVKVYDENGATISGLGGYEMQNDKGISVATEVLNSLASIDKTYSGATQYVQFLTDENGNKYKSYYNELDVVSQYLTKYSWDGALSQSQAIKADGKVNNDWYDCRYYYRVDKDTLSQKLKGSHSYMDRKSYQYNTVGIYGQTDLIKEQFKIDFDDDSEIVCLSDMFCALEDNDGAVFGEKKQAKIDLVKKIKNGEDGYKILNITIVGSASSQGNNKSASVNKARNSRLSKQRALTLKNWLIKNNFPSIDKAEITEKTDIQRGGDKYDVDDPKTKLWRCAYVVVEYEKSDIVNAVSSNSSSVNYELDKNNNPIPLKDEKTGALLNRLDKVALEDRSPREWLMNSEDGKALRQKYGLTTDIIGLNSDMTLKYGSIDPWTFTMQDANKLTGKNYTDQYSWDFDNSYLKNDTAGNVASVDKGIVERYDNEGEFFKLLEKKDPFMHNLITDKIKYFDPAFHSISPEGFNARLTFLHQCTRQGSTVGGSDNQIENTAYNLAFGRPPVCVLRLGDFYYTKIIINSINIQYEQPQWDLNPEGIGVMPMFAKINMTFVFLGGSDLAGPISRLQNAVSFNYYANTGVYDNRAEMVQYDSNGKGREVQFKPYSYPDMVHGDGNKRKRKGFVDTDDMLRELEKWQNSLTSLPTVADNEKLSGRNIVKNPLTTSSTSPQVKPTQTTNTSTNSGGNTNSGNLSQENQELVNGWNKSHPSIEKNRFQEIMGDMLNDYGKDNTTTNFVNNVFVKNNNGEFITKENCSDSDVQYIKEYFTLNGKDYVNDVGSVNINGENYLIDFDALGDYDL